jgi:hypothetical protein
MEVKKKYILLGLPKDRAGSPYSGISGFYNEARIEVESNDKNFLMDQLLNNLFEKDDIRKKLAHFINWEWVVISLNYFDSELGFLNKANKHVRYHDIFYNYQEGFNNGLGENSYYIKSLKNIEFDPQIVLTSSEIEKLIENHPSYNLILDLRKIEAEKTKDLINKEKEDKVKIIRNNELSQLKHLIKKYPNYKEILEEV